MNIAELHKRDPAKNMARSYRIWVTPTLFGDYAVVREWGRIGSTGTVREQWFESEGEAIRDGLKLRQTKEKRGYTPPAQHYSPSQTPLKAEARRRHQAAQDEAKSALDLRRRTDLKGYSHEGQRPPIMV